MTVFFFPLCPSQHFLKNCFHMATTSSVYYKFFTSTLADAILVPLEGEKQRVVDDLKKRGFDDEQIRRVKRKYYRRRMRNTIPDPETLCRNIVQVMLFFEGLPADPTPGISDPGRFLARDWRAQLEKELKYVRKGLLSDDPKLAYYYPTHKTVTGFQMYNSLRPSSRLEGYHLHLRECFSATALSSGMDVMDATLNTFDFEWCIKAGRTAGVFPDYGHFNLALMDAVHDVLGDPMLQAQDRVLPDHRRTRNMSNPGPIQYGNYYARAIWAQKVAAQADGHAPHSAAMHAPEPPRKPGVSDMERIIDVLHARCSSGVTVDVHLAPTESDLAVLCSDIAIDPSLINRPKDLEQLALNQGWISPCVCELGLFCALTLAPAFVVGLLLTGTALVALLQERFKNELAVQSLRGKGGGFNAMRAILHDKPPQPASLPKCPAPASSLPPHSGPVGSKERELPGLLGSGNPAVMQHAASGGVSVPIPTELTRKQLKTEKARLRKQAQRRRDKEAKAAAAAAAAAAAQAGVGVVPQSHPAPKRKRGRPRGPKK